MSDQPTLPGISSVTSSQAPASGPTPSVVPDGPTTGPCGPAPALASLSARQAKERGLLTSGTYGQRGTGSSESAALASFLANKLKARSSTVGSTLFNLTWKEKVTPSGRSVCLLRASVRRTPGNGCTSWPTPNKEDCKRDEWTKNALLKAVEEGTPPPTTSQRLRSFAELASWPTPRTPTGGPESGERKQELGRTESGGGDLQAAALLSSWATPRSEDGESSGMRHSRGVADTLTAQSRLASPWATPSSRDWKDTPGMSETGTNPDGTERTRLDQLPRQAGLAAWPTPNTMSGGQTSRGGNRKNELLMGGLVRSTASGETPSGSPAGTGKPGQLNPAHSRWLMGLPPVWDDCICTAMRSLPRSRRRS